MKNLLILFSCSISFITFAQSEDSTRTFLTDKFEPTKSSQEASFYELLATTPNEDDQYEVRTFFINGQIYKSGFVNDLASMEKIGLWTWWFENGQQSQLGSFVNNKKNGVWTSWNEDGSLNSKQTFENGDRNGEAQYYFSNGNLSGKVLFENDKPIKEEYWEPDGSQLLNTQIANQPPSFPGGKEKFYQYIRSNLNYPKSTKKKKLKGTVEVLFNVSRDGTIKDVSVVKGVSPELDTEAVRVVSEMPNWQEGRSMNRPVDARMVIPITF